MRQHTFLAIAAQIVLLGNIVLAHPGSGIVVDSQGQVFFQDSVARTIWKIDTQGKVTAHNDRVGGHWMALDRNGWFSDSELKLVERISPRNTTPALLVADGGAPITVNRDGNFYFGVQLSATEEVSVGMMKISPAGKREVFAPDFAKSIKNLGITGLASGPEGILYVACLTGVMKVTTNGTFTALANPVVVNDCDSDAPTCFLRGLDVDGRGMVFAAATGCRRVLKISPDGKVEIVLKSESPWSPTGVSVHNGDVYVLEYTNANGAMSEGWLPRIRKLRRDGSVTTLASISAEQQRARPNRQKAQ